MTTTEPPAVELIRHSFAAADAALGRGDYPAFFQAVIAAREGLKALPCPEGDVLPADTTARWRGLNERFECLFEWASGLELLLDPGRRTGLDTSGPNFLGAKADAALLGQLGGMAADELVFVGSGAFPQTLLYLCHATPIPVLHGVDFNPERAYFAQRLSRECGLDRRLRYTVSHGARFEYRQARVVIVASLVEDKLGVLEQIAATAESGTIVFLRSPAGWGRLLYEDVPTEARVSRLRPQTSHRPAANSLFQTRVFKVTDTEPGPLPGGGKTA
ncbi:MAG TPA: nicotianamine synthase family protein [Urbifossiella sp.]|nr:nicotianamine synthase family protein [Urbifossiella sp.]